MPALSDPLGAAEARDHYLEKCAASPMNAAARKWCIYDYSYISQDAYFYVQEVAKKIPLIHTGSTRAELVILNPTADSGMPHTRPANLICLPSKCIPHDLRPSAAFEETLLHEGIHIHQRNYPTLWNHALHNAGWEPCSVSRIPPPLLERIRINPDTIGSPFWTWNSHHVPLPLFSTQIVPRLSDARIEWLDLRTGALFKEPPPSFPKGAERGTELEHPYEIFAYQFSKKGLNTHEAILEGLREIGKPHP